MGNLKTSIAFTMALFLCVGCAENAAPPDGAQYHSRLGNFTYTIPHLIRPGAVMNEQPAATNQAGVEFMDDFGTMIRIESFRVHDHLISLAGEQGQETGFRLGTNETERESLARVFHELVMPQEFAVVSPDVKILKEDYVDTQAGKAYFAVANIPHGSTLTESVDGGPSERMDSLRGVFIFQQHDFLYIVCTQEWPMTAERRPPIPMKQRIDMRQADLLQVVAGMTFN